MTLDDVRHERRTVAVGPTAQLAGSVFGRDHGDLLLVDYEELAATDCRAVATVALVVAPGCDEAFAHAAGLAGSPSGPRLTVVAAVADHLLLAALLDRHDLRIAGVSACSSGGVAFVLSSHGDARGGTPELMVLEAVAAATPARGPLSADGHRPEQSDRRRTDRAARAVGKQRPPRRTPPLVHRYEQLARLGRSRRARLVGMVGLLVLSMLAITLVVTTGLVGVSVLMLLLGAVGVCVGVGLLLAVLVLARQVHRQTGRLEAVAHEQLLQTRATDERRSGRLDELARAAELSQDLLEAIATAQAVRDRDLQMRLSGEPAAPPTADGSSGDVSRGRR